MMPNHARVFLSSLLAVTLLWISGAPARAQTSESGSPAKQESRPVTDIRIVTQTGDVLQENPAGLPLKPGQPFSMDAERETLRQLFRTGRYADLTARLEPNAAGVRLEFVVRQNYFVNVVNIIGLTEPPSDSLAVSSLRLGLGEPFRESDIAPALDRLRNTLQDEGLYRAKL